MNNNMFQMPFPFCLNNMNANGQQNGQTEDGTTSPFGGMPQMPFPFFMPGMNNTANSDQAQQTASPFGGMPQMPFPFFMPGMNNGANGEQAQQTATPFGGMQMPFPFFMPGMNNTANSDQTQQGGFPFGGMPRMPFSFGAAGNKSEDNKMEIPPQVAELLKNVIGALINMESTPEGLEKLQKILDMVFSLIPKKEAEEN